MQTLKSKVEQLFFSIYFVISKCVYEQTADFNDTFCATDQILCYWYTMEKYGMQNEMFHTKEKNVNKQRAQRKKNGNVHAREVHGSFMQN